MWTSVFINVNSYILKGTNFKTFLKESYAIALESWTILTNFLLKLIIVVVILVWFLVSPLKYLKMASSESHKTSLNGIKQDLVDFKNDFNSSLLTKNSTVLIVD